MYSPISNILAFEKKSLHLCQQQCFSNCLCLCLCTDCNSWIRHATFSCGVSPESALGFKKRICLWTGKPILAWSGVNFTTYWTCCNCPCYLIWGRLSAVANYRQEFTISHDFLAFRRSWWWLTLCQRNGKGIHSCLLSSLLQECFIQRKRIVVDLPFLLLSKVEKELFLIAHSNIPDWFVPSMCVIDSPNKIDFDMAVLNFRASTVTIVGSIWPDLTNIAAHVAVGSQRFDNLGLYKLLEWSSTTALERIEMILPLCAMVNWLTWSAQHFRWFRRRLLGWVSLQRWKSDKH